MTRYLTLVFLGSLFVGCAATSYVNLTGLTAEDVSSRIRGQSDSFKYFSSSGYGNFETKNGAYSARFELAIRRPSQTRVNLYGPFGIKVAQVKLTPDTLLVYNSLRNEVFVAKPTMANLREFLMIAYDGTSVSDLLLDFMSPVSHLEDPELSTYQDRNKLSFIYTSSDTVEKFTVDGRYMRTVEYERLVDGKSMTLIKYSDFTNVDNIYIPKSVWFEDESHGISARLFYQDIAVNRKEDLQLNVPPDAKEIFIN